MLARPSGGEAAAGKNPVAHVGKIYSMLSHRLARLIHQSCAGVLEAYVNLAVRIGARIDRPWVSVQVVLPAGGRLPDYEPVIGAVVEGEMQRLHEFQLELIRGEHVVC